MTFFANIVADSLRGTNKHNAATNPKQPSARINHYAKSDYGLEESVPSGESDAHATVVPLAQNIETVSEDRAHDNTKIGSVPVQRTIVNHIGEMQQQSSSKASESSNSTSFDNITASQLASAKTKLLNYKQTVTVVKNANIQKNGLASNHHTATSSQAQQAGINETDSSHGVINDRKQLSELTKGIEKEHHSRQSESNIKLGAKNVSNLKQTDAAQKSKNSKAFMEADAAQNSKKTIQHKEESKPSEPHANQAVPPSVVKNTRETNTTHFDLTPKVGDRRPQTKSSDNSPRVHIGQVNVVVNKSTPSNTRTATNYLRSSFNKYKGL
jgi:hypothetical protein